MRAEGGRRLTLPRLGGFAIVLILAVGAFEPFYVRIFTADRAAMRAHLVALPDTKLPTLRRFLEDVDSEIPPGSTVAFLAPFPGFEQGYRYAYRRAAWILADHRMLPVLASDDRILHHHLARADVVVAWRTPPPPGFVVIYENPEGSVSRRAQ